MEGKEGNNYCSGILSVLISENGGGVFGWGFRFFQYVCAGGFLGVCWWYRMRNANGHQMIDLLS